MNTFGNQFRLALFGESHGEALGILIDGLPAGIPLDEADFKNDLARRRSGAAGTTPRRESDRVRIAAGLYEGRTTGAPLALLFTNENTRPGDYDRFAHHFRPSHADWVAREKFRGLNDPRGGGHFSGRLTLPLTAAGVVAKKLLDGVRFTTRLTEVGGECDPARFETVLREAAAAGDSVGAVAECRAEGCGVGWGEPFFDTAEGLIAHLLYAVPGIKGVEFGDGFAAARLRGSEHNDPILNAAGTTATNHAGGVAGGILNGNPLIVRAAFKPTASIAREQFTFDAATGRQEPLAIGGRHDVCIAIRGAAAVEAAVAIALADLKLRCRL
ncbi:chorismate synthase [uncultured Alistipes sp.]|uniref:chorismate synthase n=1 Tax=uncultured Alistipes sp. TaxID=538949 RepID=UPI0025FA2AD6|nr:chorismate synthase [uncultured Alistipes sp.]